jgi:3-methyladenine DNA glycosylase AlkD
MKSDPLLARVREELARRGDPKRAASMRAYLKSTLPCHGVPMPQVRALAKELGRDLRFRSFAAWRKQLRSLWLGAGFREERHFTVELTGVPASRPFQTPDALPLYEEMIVTGAWWDLVDGLATWRLGGLLRSHAAEVKPTMLDWSRSDDLWKRRSAVICQVGLKERTDLELLYACIEPALDSKEFFLRKAIGWALRQYARTDPREVRRYVRVHEKRLSALSRREALKHLSA